MTDHGPGTQIWFPHSMFQSVNSYMKLLIITERRKLQIKKLNALVAPLHRCLQHAEKLLLLAQMLYDDILAFELLGARGLFIHPKSIYSAVTSYYITHRWEMHGYLESETAQDNLALDLLHSSPYNHHSSNQLGVASP